VKKGDPLIVFSRAEIKKSGFDTATPLVITNSDEFDVEIIKSGKVKAGEGIIRIKKVK
jgi:PTS system beta-glucosides-specific IIC component